jgi:hypothetical protein
MAATLRQEDWDTSLAYAACDDCGWREPHSGATRVDDAQRRAAIHNRRFHSGPSEDEFRRFDPANQCEGKRPYPTKRDAKAAARAIEQRTGRLRPYRCCHCGKFHIGHPVGQAWDWGAT